MSDYKGIRLPALRKIAEDKGLKDYEDMERPELLDALKSLDTPDEVRDEEEKTEDDEVEEVEETEDEDLEVEEAPKEEVGITDGRIPKGSKAEIMKARLALQEKVSIMIPLEGKEKKGSTFPVTLNGYRLNIQKGVYVKVPKQVADIVMDSQSQTIAAADELKRLDGSPRKIDGDSPSELS